jgi:predicted nucleic acid-binding protein
VIVDTSVWSLLLRRNSVEKSNPYVKMLYSYLENQYCIHLPGIVLLEILDGIKIEKQFDMLNEYFEAFPLITLERQDFIEAARLKISVEAKAYKLDQ